MPYPDVPVGFGEFINSLPDPDFALHVLYSGAAGISLGLIVFICILFRKRPTRNLLTWIFFLISILALLVFLVLCIITILRRFQQFKLGLFLTLSYTDIETFDDPDEMMAILGIHLGDTDNFDLWTRSCRSIFQAILVMISDGAICYRAGALTQRKSLRVCLALSSVICLGSGTIMISLYIQENTWSGSRQDFWTEFEYNLSFGFFGWSVLCNLTATAVFGSTLWTYRKFLTAKLEPNRLKVRVTPSQRILGSVVESGLVFCAFQIVYLIVITVMIPHMANLRAVSYLQLVYTGVSGMYPALIFLGTNLQS